MRERWKIKRWEKNLKFFWKKKERKRKREKGKGKGEKLLLATITCTSIYWLLPLTSNSCHEFPQRIMEWNWWVWNVILAVCNPHPYHCFSSEEAYCWAFICLKNISLILLKMGQNKARRLTIATPFLPRQLKTSTPSLRRPCTHQDETTKGQVWKDPSKNHVGSLSPGYKIKCTKGIKGKTLRVARGQWQFFNQLNSTETKLIRNYFCRGQPQPNSIQGGSRSSYGLVI